MMHKPCGTDVPTEIGAVVTHMAECPHTPSEIAETCREIVSTVSRAAEMETPAVSPETPRDTEPDGETAPVSPETADDAATVSSETPEPSSETAPVSPETPRDTRPMTPARMAELRDARMSLRDIAALAGVGHETVRRLVAGYRAGQIGGDGGDSS